MALSAIFFLTLPENWQSLIVWPRNTISPGLMTDITSTLEIPATTRPLQLDFATWTTSWIVSPFLSRGPTYTTTWAYGRMFLKEHFVKPWMVQPPGWPPPATFTCYDEDMKYTEYQDQIWSLSRGIAIKCCSYTTWTFLNESDLLHTSSLDPM